MNSGPPPPPYSGPQPFDDGPHLDPSSGYTGGYFGANRARLWIQVIVVVAAGSGVLTALIRPSYLKALDAQTLQKGREHIKGIALTLVMYYGDNDERFPPPAHWRHTILEGKTFIFGAPPGQPALQAGQSHTVGMVDDEGRSDEPPVAFRKSLAGTPVSALEDLGHTIALFNTTVTGPSPVADLNTLPNPCYFQAPLGPVNLGASADGGLRLLDDFTRQFYK